MTKPKAPPSKKATPKSTGGGPQAGKSKRPAAPPPPVASRASFDPGQPLANARHEIFAQEIAKGSSPEAAYSTVGFSRHNGNPYRLRENESVSARIAWLLARAAEKTEITLARVLKELASIAFDRSPGTRNSDRIAALHLLGKNCGGFVSRVAVGGDDAAPPIRVENAASARERIAKKIASLASKVDKPSAKRTLEL